MRELLLPCALLLIPYCAAAQTPTESCLPGPAQAGCATILQPIGSTAAESSHVLKVGPTNIIGFQMNNTSSSASWALLYDGNAVPVNGTLPGCANAQTGRPCIAKYYQLPANTTVGASWAPGPGIALQQGAILLCSSTGPYTLTLTANCVFSGDIQ